MALPNVFTSGDVFTAANANLLRSNQFNQTTSTKTVSYVLVAADVGTRVLMNAAGSTTITVNTSLFAAGDTLEISNIGAGVCTITAGTATVSTSGTLALVANAGGTLFFISAGVSVFIASGVTASAGALVRVGGGSLSGAATTFSSVFSATYDAYDIVCTNLTTGSSGVGIELTLGSTVTGYYYGGVGAPPSGSSVLFQGNNVAFWEASVVDTGSSGATYKLWNPFLSKKTIFQSQRINPSTTGNMGTVQGMVNNTTSYTAFTMSVSGTTWTSGTVNIYGYSLS